MSTLPPITEVPPTSNFDFSTITNTFSDIGASIYDGASHAYTVITDGVYDAANAIYEFGTDKATVIADGLSSFGSSVYETGSKVFNVASDKLAEISTWVQQNPGMAVGALGATLVASAIIYLIYAQIQTISTQRAERADLVTVLQNTQTEKAQADKALKDAVALRAKLDAEIPLTASDRGKAMGFGPLNAKAEQPQEGQHVLTIANLKYLAEEAQAKVDKAEQALVDFDNPAPVVV